MTKQHGKVKKPHDTKSAITEYLEKTSSVKDTVGEELFLVSFKDYDDTQGSGLDQWQLNRYLAPAIQVLIHYCKQPLQPDKKKFVIYGDFPDKSKFHHPAHIPLDANWARIHVDGVHIIAGHVFRNIFYVVFLDDTHSFAISEKKHT